MLQAPDKEGIESDGEEDDEYDIADMWDLAVKESVWCPLCQAKTGHSASEARYRGEDPRHLLESRDRSIQRQKRFLPGPVPVEYVYPRERVHVGVVERGAWCPPEPSPRGATRAHFFFGSVHHWF